VLYAVTLIEDAVNRRQLECANGKDALDYWRQYNNPIFLGLHQLALVLLFLLLLIEDPAVELLDVEPAYYIPMIIELLLLAFFAFRLYQLYRAQGLESFKCAKNIIFIMCLVLTLFDMSLYLILREVGNINVRPGDQNLDRRGVFRFLRVLRPAFIICSEEKQTIRRAVKNIWNTIPDIVSILLLLVGSILLFGLMAFKLFKPRDFPGAPTYYFETYWDSFFDLYVLMTTANSPDVFMPAYNDSDGWMIFFMIFIVLDTYIFMNLFLAVIYNNYKQNVHADVAQSVANKHDKLRRSFRILEKVFVAIDYSGYQLICDIVCPMQSKNITAVQWLILSDGKERITEDDFLYVGNIFAVQLLEKNPNDVFSIVEKYFPRAYNHPISQRIIGWVKDDPYKVWFMRFFDVAILANAICIGLDIEAAEWYFLSLFVVELMLRLYAYGTFEFFSIHRLWNIFDFTIIAATLIATIIEAALEETSGTPRAALDILMILRCLRLLRIFNSIQRFRIILVTIKNILPSLGTYCVVIVCIYTVYAIIGMECFQGYVKDIGGFDDPQAQHCGNIALAGDPFATAQYCKNNFNDYIHSFVTLFELTVVNQWHIITRGYVAVTNAGAFVYFISFHMIQVLLVMNIVVAFTLEAFLLEYESQRTELETRVDRRIRELGLESKKDEATVIFDRDQAYVANGVQFKLVRGMTGIDDLLERMFVAEEKKDV